MATLKKDIYGLTAREKLFADYYIIDFNGAEAARKSGYAEKNARITASKLLTKSNIQKYLNGKKEKVAAKIDITVERTLAEIARIAFQNPKNLFHPDGSFKSIHEMDDDTSATLSTVEVDEDVKNIKGINKVVARRLKIKTWDKSKSLEMLAKHLQIYSDAPPPSDINLNFKKITFR